MLPSLFTIAWRASAAAIDRYLSRPQPTGEPPWTDPTRLDTALFGPHCPREVRELSPGQLLHAWVTARASLDDWNARAFRRRIDQALDERVEAADRAGDRWFAQLTLIEREIQRRSTQPAPPEPILTAIAAMWGPQPGHYRPTVHGDS